MRYIHSQEILEIPEGGKFFFSSDFIRIADPIDYAGGIVSLLG
jgi:hypothetical protein